MIAPNSRDRKGGRREEEGEAWKNLRGGAEEC